MLIEITNKNFKEEVEQSTLPVFLDFWAPWCGPCRMLGPTIGELAKEFDGKITMGKVNVDEHMELASRFEVVSIPTLILFIGGKPEAKVIGFHSKEDFVKMLNEYI